MNNYIDVPPKNITTREDGKIVVTYESRLHLIDYNGELKNK